MSQKLGRACATEKAPDNELVSINVETKLIQGYSSEGPPGGGEVNFKLGQVTCMSQADCLPISVTLSIANGLDFPPMKCGWLYSPQLTHFSALVLSAITGLSQPNLPPFNSNDLTLAEDPYPSLLISATSAISSVPSSPIVCFEITSPRVDH